MDKELRRKKALAEYPNLEEADFDYIASRNSLRELKAQHSRSAAEARLKIKQKRAEIREKREKKMLDMYLKGSTLEEVGNEFGVSRERIRQIITHNPEYTDKQKRKEKSPPVKKEWVCKICKKHVDRIMRASVPVPNTCGETKCIGQALRNTKYGEGYISIDQLPIKEQRRYNNQRTKKYYHTVLKNRPDFKEIIYKRNHSPKAKLYRKKWLDSLSIRKKREMYRKHAESFRKRYRTDPEFRQRVLEKQRRSYRKIRAKIKV